MEARGQHHENQTRSTFRHRAPGRFHRLEFIFLAAKPRISTSYELPCATRINLVKLDVQGHEAVVLKSMKQTIDRLKPRAIPFEDDYGRDPTSTRHGVLISQIKDILDSYEIMGDQKKQCLDLNLRKWVLGATII